MWWSVVLAVIGVLGLYLTTRKMAAGYAVGVGVQVLWITYAVVTAQYGFIFSALAFGAVNFLGFVRWTREKREAKLVESNDNIVVKISRLPPSEFLKTGDAKWNYYPFIETWGERVIIGPSTKRIVLTANEAHNAGRALVESSKFIFSNQDKG